MTVKEIAREVIDALPTEKSMDDIIHALYIRSKFLRGEEEIRAGNGISHDIAKKRLKKWIH